MLSISQVRDGSGTYPLSNANNKIPTPLFVSPERGEDEYPKALVSFGFHRDKDEFLRICINLEDPWIVSTRKHGHPFYNV